MFHSSVKVRELTLKIASVWRNNRRTQTKKYGSEYNSSHRITPDGPSVFFYISIAVWPRWQRLLEWCAGEEWVLLCTQGAEPVFAPRLCFTSRELLPPTVETQRTRWRALSVRTRALQVYRARNAHVRASCPTPRHKPFVSAACFALFRYKVPTVIMGWWYNWWRSPFRLISLEYLIFFPSDEFVIPDLYKAETKETVLSDRREKNVTVFQRNLFVMTLKLRRVKFYF